MTTPNVAFKQRNSVNNIYFLLLLQLKYSLSQQVPLIITTDEGTYRVHTEKLKYANAAEECHLAKASDANLLESDLKNQYKKQEIYFWLSKTGNEKAPGYCKILKYIGTAITNKVKGGDTLCNEEHFYICEITEVTKVEMEKLAIEILKSRKRNIPYTFWLEKKDVLKSECSVLELKKQNSINHYQILPAPNCSGKHLFICDFTTYKSFYIRTSNNTYHIRTTGLTHKEARDDCINTNNTHLGYGVGPSELVIITSEIRNRPEFSSYIHTYHFWLDNQGVNETNCNVLEVNQSQFVSHSSTDCSLNLFFICDYKAQTDIMFGPPLTQYDYHVFTSPVKHYIAQQKCWGMNKLYDYSLQLAQFDEYSNQSDVFISVLETMPGYGPWLTNYSFHVEEPLSGGHARYHICTVLKFTRAEPYGTVTREFITAKNQCSKPYMYVCTTFVKTTTQDHHRPTPSSTPPPIRTAAVDYHNERHTPTLTDEPDYFCAKRKECIQVVSLAGFIFILLSAGAIWQCWDRLRVCGTKIASGVRKCFGCNQIIPENAEVDRVRII